MRGNLLLNYLWYEDISPETLADVLDLTPEELYQKIFEYAEFTPLEVKQIVGLLSLTEEDTDMIFYS